LIGAETCPLESVYSGITTLPVPVTVFTFTWANKYGYRFELNTYFTEVQGEVNAASMRKKFLEIFESKIKFDLVVVIRGGGAQTDFLIFDQYIIGQVIARFPIPVLTGIGHQKNSTIADLMAHTSVKTPTEAAETIIKQNRAFDERLANIQQTLIIKAQQFLSHHTVQLSNIKAQITQAGYQLISEDKRQLNNIRQNIISRGREIPYNHRMILSHAVTTLLTYPKVLMGVKRGQLTNTFANIKANQSGFIKSSRGQLSHFTSIFEAVSPEKTLKRGFAIVSYKGRIISDPDKLNKGDDFSVIMKDAELKVLLQEKKQYDGI
jgi:exodeoxyribonuclease VII large subunit